MSAPRTRRLTVAELDAVIDAVLARLAGELDDAIPAALTGDTRDAAVDAHRAALDSARDVLTAQRDRRGRRGSAGAR